MGQTGLIGRQAIERDGDQCLPNFVPGFKPHLLRDGYRAITHVGPTRYSGRQVASIFLRELFAETQRTTGERPRDVVVGTPVDCFEPYRAHLKAILTSLGVTRFRSLDEPIAAAIGYGLRVDDPQHVLVIDFGGGTLDLALVEFEEQGVERGSCRILAKEGRAIGGNLVDAWLLEELCSRLGYQLRHFTGDPQATWWHRLMLEEACKLKESLFFHPRGTFFHTPPRELQRLRSQFPGRREEVGSQLSFTREELVALLESHGLYQAFEELLDRLLESASRRGMSDSSLKAVLMVGGSTLLPDIYPRVERRFGRDRVRAWQPFDAVAFGAAAYASGQLVKSDFITHDYALQTVAHGSQTPEYQVVVPAGTPFPSPREVWKKVLTPTCALGEPEKLFKLVICELGRAHGHHQAFVWDVGGQVHSAHEGAASPLAIPLNDANPTLGTLDPPQLPGDRSARLEVSFGVNDDRWLCTTVLDLKTRKLLLDNVPVVRLK
jgi:molecular chaperone DnaK (HSP70)